MLEIFFGFFGAFKATCLSSVNSELLSDVVVELLKETNPDKSLVRVPQHVHLWKLCAFFSVRYQCPAGCLNDKARVFGTLFYESVSAPCGLPSRVCEGGWWFSRDRIFFPPLGPRATPVSGHAD